MSISNDEFKSALSRFASGVTVVTTKDTAGNLQGLTVSAFTSLSMEPPLILVCILKTTPSYATFEGAGAFVVNILSETQQHISNQFAYKREDKFEGIEYEPGLRGLPVIKGCLANLECKLRHSYDGGDHTIFVGEIEKATLRDGKPLVYFCGKYREITD